MRHYLNDALRSGGGHIGYGILEKYRGRGYATKCLELTIEKARELVAEDELYLSALGQSTSCVQEKNGAYIQHLDEKEYYTRIPLEKTLEKSTKD